MGHCVLRTMLVVCTIVATLAPNQVAPQASAAACETFPQTGKTVCDPFLGYWRTHGGLVQQGLPLTDELVEVSAIDQKPYTVQYFERARFEKHPEKAPPYDVLLGLLGREQAMAKYPTPPAAIPGDPFNNPALPQECATFAQTGKRVCGPFLDYWRTHGDLAQQGLPLTDIFLEKSPTNALTYPTQYFERARFEYHYELPARRMPSSWACSGVSNCWPAILMAYRSYAMTSPTRRAAGRPYGRPPVPQAMTTVGFA